MNDDSPHFQSMGDQPTAAYDAIDGIAPEIAAEQKSVALNPGDIVSDRFQVVDQLGFGGMGAVYRVKDLRMNEERAFKVMLPSLLQSEKAQSRFLEEIKISQRLSHDRIVRVHDLTIDKKRGIQFFTMELVEGTTLGRKMFDEGGKLPLDDALHIMDQLCEALAYAHQYTIHRDLKPQNIMVQPDGNIKVLDFGLAKLMSPGRMNKSSMALGTAYYQSPEQSVHLTELDQRADIYSLGIILYQMLTGEVPVGRFKTPNEIDPSIPLHVSEATILCLEPRPDDRYSEVSQFARALHTPLGKSTTKSPSGLVAVAALLVVLIGAGGWWFARGASTTPDEVSDVPPLTTTPESIAPGVEEVVADVPEEISVSAMTAANALEAKEGAEAARTAAQAAKGEELAAKAFTDAKATFAEGENYSDQKNFDKAVEAFTTAGLAFAAVETKSKTVQIEMANLENAQKANLAAKTAAENAEAKEYAPVLYAQAETDEKAAGDLQDRAQKMLAYNRSTTTYHNAVAKARTAKAAAVQAEAMQSEEESAAAAEAKRIREAALKKEAEMEAAAKAETDALNMAIKDMDRAKTAAINADAERLAAFLFNEAGAAEAKASTLDNHSAQTAQYLATREAYVLAMNEAQAQTRKMAAEKAKKTAVADSAAALTLQSMQAAQAAAKSARTNAQTAGVTRYASTERANADATMARADAATKDPAMAKQLYDEAATQYKNALSVAATQSSDAKSGVDAARAKASVLREDIGIREKRAAKREVTSGDSAWDAAEAAGTNYAKAKEEYERAAQFYDEAISIAKKTINRVGPVPNR